MGKLMLRKSPVKPPDVDFLVGVSVEYVGMSWVMY